MKIYYDKSNDNELVLCEDIIENRKDELSFIELDNIDYDSLFVCKYGYRYVVEKGKIVLKENTTITSTQEYKDLQKQIDIDTYQNYLNSTDYVIAKLNELRLDDEEEYQKELENYKEVLEKRKEYRKLLNSLK